MQNTRSLSASGAGGAAPRPDPHIGQNRLLMREFAHDRSAVLLLALDTVIRRTALAVAGRFGRI